jgi:hypothetical protein
MLRKDFSRRVPAAASSRVFLLAAQDTEEGQPTPVSLSRAKRTTCRHNLSLPEKFLQDYEAVMLQRTSSVRSCLRVQICGCTKI